MSDFADLHLWEVPQRVAWNLDEVEAWLAQRRRACLGGAKIAAGQDVY